MSWPPKDSTPYRPSNGSEGEGFESHFCGRCKRDAAFQANPDGADGCPIIAAMYAFQDDHPKYPKEVIWKDGHGVCTAFEHVDDEDERITDEERAANLELPLQAA